MIWSSVILELAAACLDLLPDILRINVCLNYIDGFIYIYRLISFRQILIQVKLAKLAS